MIRLIRCAVLALMLAPTIVLAQDFQTGKVAYGAGDYSTAFREWTPLAALLHKSADGRGSPFLGQDLSHSFSDGRSERGEAVQDGDTDRELGDLT